MALVEEYIESGNWLFKRRSYLPVVLFIFVLAIFYIRPSDIFIAKTIVFDLTCLAVSLLGLIIRSITIGYVLKGTYGRNVDRQVADALNTKGIYSIVRHPLYLGNYFMWLGILMFVGIWWFVLAVSLMFWIYYERIMMAEEAFLTGKFGEHYKEWSSRTPAFWPKFSIWQSSDLTFSFVNVLKREFNGLLAMIVSFVYVDFLRHTFYGGDYTVSKFWIYAGIFGVTQFIIIRFLKKKTKLLKVKSR